MKIYTETKSMDVDIDKIDSLVEALEFKGLNITAKADPRIFLAAATMLRTLKESRDAWRRNCLDYDNAIRELKGEGNGGLIRRADVFNFLAVVPMDSETRARIYSHLQEMEGVEL